MKKKEKEKQNFSNFTVYPSKVTEREFLLFPKKACSSSYVAIFPNQWVGRIRTWESGLDFLCTLPIEGKASQEKFTVLSQKYLIDYFFLLNRRQKHLRSEIDPQWLTTPESMNPLLNLSWTKSQKHLRVTILPRRVPTMKKISLL